jgi:hypothetical protein
MIASGLFKVEEIRSTESTSTCFVIGNLLLHQLPYGHLIFTYPFANGFFFIHLQMIFCQLFTIDRTLKLQLGLVRCCNSGSSCNRCALRVANNA